MLYAAAAIFVLVILTIVLAKARAVNALTRTAKASVILIPAIPNDGEFERRVRAFHAEQMFCDGRYAGDIVMVITDPCMADKAFGLAEELDGVTAVWLGEVEKFLTENYKEYNLSDS